MRLIRALDEYVIEGIDTNIQMLKKILNHKNFRDAKFDISWYDKNKFIKYVSFYRFSFKSL